MIILQPYFGQENLQLHYIDTDSFALSIKTKDVIEDLFNLKDLFDFSNLIQRIINYLVMKIKKL